MPQEIAATWSLSGLIEMIERLIIQAKQSLSATQAPVIAAVRVPPSGLDHVAIDHDLALAESVQIDHGAQRAPDQALDFLCAPGRLAGIHLSAGPFMRGARQHGVFRRHPALAGAAQPWRAALFERSGAEHLRLTEGNEARAFRIARDAAFEGDGTQLIGLSFGRAHGSAPVSSGVIDRASASGKAVKGWSRWPQGGFHVIHSSLKKNIMTLWMHRRAFAALEDRSTADDDATSE